MMMREHPNELTLPTVQSELVTRTESGTQNFPCQKRLFHLAGLEIASHGS